MEFLGFYSRSFRVNRKYPAIGEFSPLWNSWRIPDNYGNIAGAGDSQGSNFWRTTNKK